MKEPKAKVLHGFRSVPQNIVEQFRGLDDSTFQIGFRRKFSKAELREGALAHAGVTVQEGRLNYQKSFLPEPDKRWAKRNLYGQVKIRRDLPKHPVSWSLTTPNFGDGAKFGYSTHSRSMMAYRKQVIHGKGFPITVSHEDLDSETTVVTFLCDLVFETSIDKNDSDLLMAVSLIGETVGYPQVLASGQSVADWVGTQSVSWELLPTGQVSELPEFDTVARRFSQQSGQQLPDTYRERFEAMRALSPSEIYSGSSGFTRYLAFIFPKAVVLENFSYGNAAYVMFDDWKELSQRSRPDLLSDPTANFVRVIHRANWVARIKAEITATGNQET